MQELHGKDRPPAVFLDRDGTLIEDIGYINEVAQIQMYPWTAAAVRKLNHAGLKVSVVTNQSAVARGVVTEERLAELHQHISTVLAEHGAHIDAFFYCPHHPEGTVERYSMRCTCRKPGPGLIEQAARAFSFEPGRSFVVGDTWLDVGLARSVGARGLLVRTGHGAGQEAKPHESLHADAVVDTLADAVEWILERLSAERLEANRE
jgi:D-glycero-D-manno-heptose 1,7-bisphosphate phosphatase